MPNHQNNQYNLVENQEFESFENNDIAEELIRENNNIQPEPNV
jgi:hypothetical protein